MNMYIMFLCWRNVTETTTMYRMSGAIDNYVLALFVDSDI